ncbi:MAG: stage III sporulation protein AE [Lachnospiraceae bacterium]|nr:stage III sporulation protein AE [Lachnospiraceae bacterium]
MEITIENPYDMSAIRGGLDSLFPGINVDIDSILFLIMRGQLIEAGKELFGQIGSGLVGEIAGIRTLLAAILILGIVSAIFSNFTDIFSDGQLSKVAYYFTYLFMMVVLTSAFLEIARITTTTIENILLFVKIMVPTYFLSVGAAVGITTATAGYQLILIVAYLVQSFLVAIIVPLIYCYAIMALLGGLWTEDRLELILDLIKKTISTILKVSLGIVAGISFLQSIITPAIDGIKATAFKRILSIIPGIGNLAEGVTEMVVGSAILVKNSLGILILFVLVFICITPLFKIMIIAGVVKLSAALTAIICDKRIMRCTDRIGDAGFLLFKSVFTSVSLFFILIAILAYTLR